MTRQVQFHVETHEASTDFMDFLTTTAGKNALAGEIVLKHRTIAEQRAREVGGKLVTDRQPEFNIGKGMDLNGIEYMLTASRWWVTVPNAFDMERASGLSR